jgi:hypothetical protein
MEALYKRFFERLPVRSEKTDSHLHLLNVTEQEQLHRIRVRAMWVAAGINLLYNTFYFLPLYFLPHLFPKISISLPFLKAPLQISLIEVAYSLVLSFAEITLLVLLNLTSAHDVGVATGYIHPANKQVQGETILRVGMETPAREVTEYGIDPFQGANKVFLFAFNTLNKMKGMIAHQFLRVLLTRILGRFAFREILDLSGLPIFMGLNAWGARVVVIQAQVVLMGQTVIERLIQSLPQRTLPPDEENLLYDTLEYIAISKRDFHQNHYLLTRRLIEHYQIKPQEYHLLSADFLTRLAESPNRIRNVCALIIAIGFLLDGRVSWRERAQVKRLHQAGILKENDAELQEFARAFVAGSGIDTLVERYLIGVPTVKKPVSGEVLEK